MTQVEKIKAEIERLKNELSDNKERLSLGEIIAVNNCYNNLIFFINSLEEEPISNDLEEAARKIATWHSHITGDTYIPNDAWFFKKGAQWQKERMIDKAFKYINYQLNLPSDFEQHFRKAMEDKL